MKKNSKGFSLVELVVWVSISLILMIWVWVFVTSWMKNISIQKQILDQNYEIETFENKLYDIFSNDFEIISLADSWILVKSNFLLWKNSFYDIWVKTQSWECENDLSIETKYLRIKSFNPFIFNPSVYSWEYIKNWNEISLNIFSSSTSSGIINFVSDFWNNKIFYLENWEVKDLLDINDGIYKPTWILYNSWILYILNKSWKELLSFSSELKSPPNSLNINFTPNSDIIWVSELIFDFNKNITSPNSSWSFTFSWFTKWSEDFVSNWTTLKYIFSWSTIIFSSWSNYEIKIDNLAWDFNSTWSYYVKLTLSWTDFYSHYFTSWDNNLTTFSDNTLLTITWWLNKNYSEITLNWNNLVLKDFVSKEYLELNQNWDFVWTWSLTSIPNFQSRELDFWFKIKDFKVYKSWNLLTLKIDYYKNFSCFSENDNIIKTIIFKKTLSN